MWKALLLPTSPAYFYHPFRAQFRQKRTIIFMYGDYSLLSKIALNGVIFLRRTALRYTGNNIVHSIYKNHAL